MDYENNHTQQGVQIWASILSPGGVVWHEANAVKHLTQADFGTHLKTLEGVIELTKWHNHPTLPHTSHSEVVK